jgi:cytochrome c-type biogenesis protein CcmF
VLTSVHSFAADPERGLFILLLLGIVIGGSLMLYALRVPVVSSVANFSGWCRENLLLLNNILLVVACATVLLGTLFPLIADAFKLGKYSVGPPYFNAVFCPLMAVLIVFMAYGPLARWKRMPVNELVNPLWLSLVAAVVSAAIAMWMTGTDENRFLHWGVALGVGLATWLVLAIIVEFFQKIRHAPSLISGIKKLRAGWWGMAIAHFGMAMSTAGIAVVSGLTEERDIRLVQNQVADVSGYQFRLLGSSHFEGPNYIADVVSLEVTAPDNSVFQLAPEKRVYHAKRGQMMTEAAIDADFWRDIYVAVGERLENDAWAVRLHYKPLVRWIWLGAIFMALGGVLAIFDKRYRQTAAQVSTAGV